jgi:hypothetical protein
MANLEWNVVDGTVSNVRRGDALGKAGKPYVITYVYAVDGLVYGGKFRTFAGQWYAKGDAIAVRYNPAEPRENDMGGRRQWATWFHLSYCAVGVIILFCLLLRGCS